MKEWWTPLKAVRKRIGFIRLWKWMKWGFLVGLVFGLIVLCLARMIPMSDHVEWSISLFFLGGLMGFGIGLWQWPSWTEVIHQTDRILQLQESLVTSWEMQKQEGAIISMQRRDALRRLHESLPTLSQKLPFDWGNLREAFLGFTLLTSMVALILIPNPLTEIAQKREQEKKVIEQAKEKIAALEKRAHQDQEIDLQTKQKLQQELRHLLEQLKESSTLERALEEIAKSEEKLNVLEQMQQISKSDQTLLQALQENRKLSSLHELIHESEDLDLIQKKSEEAYQTLTEEEKEQLSNRLKQVDSPNQVAEKIERDAPDAKESFGQMVSSASQSIQQQQKNTASINHTRQTLQESKDQILVALRPGSPNSQTNADNPPNPIPSDQKQTGRSQQQEKQNQQNASNHANTEHSENHDQPRPQPGSDMRIYIPFSKITGKGKTEVVGGPTQEGPEQHSERLSTERGTTLPYHEVFARYQSELREAIERGELPSEWQPMIRDYFSSIEP